MEFLLSAQAKKDIVDLALYIAQDNPEVGAAVFDDVWDTCELLASMPNMGAPIGTLLDETEIRYEIREILHALPLLENIRRFPLSRFKRVMVFYQIQDDILDVIRVIHGSRDLPAILASMVTES